MEKQRRLKLPDGGSFDLAIPEGFGAPIFAMNDAAPAIKRGWLIVGAVLGIAAAVSFWKALRA